MTRSRFRPQLEVLEDRSMPSSWFTWGPPVVSYNCGPYSVSQQGPTLSSGYSVSSFSVSPGSYGVSLSAPGGFGGVQCSVSKQGVNCSTQFNANVCNNRPPSPPSYSPSYSPSYTWARWAVGTVAAAAVTYGSYLALAF